MIKIGFFVVNKVFFCLHLVLNLAFLIEHFGYSKYFGIYNLKCRNPYKPSLSELALQTQLNIPINSGQK